jgi:hypothetical protein
MSDQDFSYDVVGTEDYETDPVVQEVDEIRNSVFALQAEALVNEFPELGDPNIAPQVLEAARNQAERMGAPHLALNAEHIRNTYLAGAAEFAIKSNAPLTQEQLAERDTEAMFGGARQGRRALPFG